MINTNGTVIASIPLAILDIPMAVATSPIPCIVLSRGRGLPPGLLEIANERGISVFGSPMISMKFINAATLLLERAFAPSTKEHGCMVDIQGIGLYISQN